MKAKLSLRIAAAITLVHAALHTIGGVFGKPLPGPAAQAVAAMQANHFVLLGAPRTYWDFYIGFGLGITTFLTVEAIVFWLLSCLVVRDGARLRPILVTFALGYLAFTANSYCHFFLLPVVTELLIVVCLVLAAVYAKSNATTTTAEEGRA